MVRDQQRIAVLAANAAVATEAWHGIVVDTSGRSMNLSGVYTAVWKRVPEGWRIVADNNSYPMPEPQPAPAPAKRRR
jgi:ketosteroid isomerase-like protein